MAVGSPSNAAEPPLGAVAALLPPETRAVLSRVALGSTSPAKVEAVEVALRQLHGRFVPVTHLSVPSGVAPQPFGSEEAYRGALARATGALRLVPGALLGLGIEAGVELPLGDAGALFAGAWVVAVDRQGRTGAARSAAFEVPERLAQAVSAGAELGEALDAAYGLERAKDGPGAAGVLSRGLVVRSVLYAPAVLLALSPWLAPDPGQT